MCAFAARKTVTRDDLAGVVAAAFGGRRRLVSVSRLRGGSKKGVYRLMLSDGGSAIAYVWDDAENYWPDPATGATASHADPFAAASGLPLFLAAQRRLAGLGVRTPRVLLSDADKNYYPADIAVIEDVPGANLETLLERDPDGAGPAMARLAAALSAMHGELSPVFGKVAFVEAGGTAAGSCEQVVLSRALHDLADAATREGRIGGFRDDLDGVLRGLFAGLRPRAEYRLIHGELGPDHVLVDAAGEPVLIDIEGLMFFDVEWEHVFLRLRFGQHYRWLSGGGDLDQQRLRCYALAMHLSLVAGPLRLLDGDFPDREGMLRIVQHNIGRVLGFLPG